MIVDDRGDRQIKALYERLAPAARRRRLEAGEELLIRDTISIPVDAVATLQLCQEDARLHAGFAARGDMIGVQTLFDGDCPPLRALVLRPGEFIQIPRLALGDLMLTDMKVRSALSAYAVRSTSLFLAEAVKSLTFNIERRTARWVDGCRAAMRDDVLSVTHQELATSLGVRRSGVTVALHVLEGERLVRSQRGRIVVLDAEGLRRFWRQGEAAASERGMRGNPRRGSPSLPLPA